MTATVALGGPYPWAQALAAPHCGRTKPRRHINTFAMEMNVFLVRQRCDRRIPTMRSWDRHGTDPEKNAGTSPTQGIWHIDKIIYGKRICESTRTGDRIEAEALLARRVTQARRVHLFGEQREHTFREAAAKFLAENFPRFFNRHRCHLHFSFSLGKYREGALLTPPRRV